MFINILLNLFGSRILDIDDAIVKNINGTIITNNKFKNKSPRGFTTVAFSLNIRPHIPPMITNVNNIIVFL